jgi:hypothetical protein
LDLGFSSFFKLSWQSEIRKIEVGQCYFNYFERFSTILGGKKSLKILCYDPIFAQTIRNLGKSAKFLGWKYF